MAKTWQDYINEIPKNLPQRQDSTLEQLIDLRMIANRLGFYDAADFLGKYTESAEEALKLSFPKDNLFKELTDKEPATNFPIQAQEASSEVFVLRLKILAAGVDLETLEAFEEAFLKENLQTAVANDFRMDELDAVMVSVDKWLNGGALKNNPATRAADAREVALQAIEKESRKLKELAQQILSMKYVINNPSAWEHFNQQASNWIEELVSLAKKTED